MYSPDVWDRNLTSLIRSGAFNEKGSIEPMSAFKWTKLVDYFEYEGIIDVFADGAETHYYDDDLNLPESQRERVAQLLKKNHPQPVSDRYRIGSTTMNNESLNDRLNNILKKEYTDKDMSWETLLLLSVLIHTIHSMIRGERSLRGLIDIGCLVRNEGDHIDYVRLQSYLKRLELTRASKLAGRFLTGVLGFSKEEVPFAGRVQKADTSRFFKTVIHPSRSRTSMLLLSPREAYATLRVKVAKDGMEEME